MKALLEIWEYRQMIIRFVKKDLRTRYKQSVLGFLWTFINPIFQLVIYSVVFGLIMDVKIENYSIYLFVGLVPWLFCSSSLTAGSQCILAQAGLVTKVYFPRIVIPISTVCSNFMNMLFSFIIVFAALFFFGIGISPALVFLPVIMVIQFFFVLGLVLIFSALTVYFRDLEHILGIFTMAWFYITPIIYSMDQIPDRLKPVAYANPMTSITLSYQDILVNKQFPDFNHLTLTIVFSVVFMFIGYVVFQKLQRRFAEEL
jgi:ABC-type polysaccharide/polyol phosphate export systems, permease component